jgi:hypothetical protein
MMKIAVRHLVIATAWALSMAGTSTDAAVIHGCYLESTGALRILVGANKRCSSNERPIDWDQEGPPGPAGSPGGQQPSSWAIAAPAHVLPLGQYVAVGDLTSNNGGSGGQIVVPFTGKILATASVSAHNVSPNTASTRCDLFISDGTGPQNGLTDIGGGGSTVGQADAYFVVVGVANKPAGTYNLVLQCNSNFADSVTVRMGTLIVWAAN